MNGVAGVSTRTHSRSNARAFVRVRPHAARPAFVTAAPFEFEASDFAITVPIVDVSGGGVAFFAPLRDAAHLLPGRRLRLEVTFPGVTQLGVTGVVRSLAQHGLDVRCGVAFHADEKFPRTQATILRYVMARQQEQLAARMR